MNEELQTLLDLIRKQKGGSPKDYRLLLDKIAYHESKYDPESKQKDGGPGRGLYQFEEGDNLGGITAARRTKNYLNANNIRSPKWLDSVASNKSLDVSTLKPYQQDMLFLGNMMEHPRADFSKVMSGEQEPVDFWLNNHWAGHDKSEKVKRRKSFNRDMETFEQRVPMSPMKPPVTEPLKSKSEPEAPSTFNSLSFLNDYLSNGGSVEGKQDSDLNYFNGGGTHEENPLGGIPVGMNNKGGYNKVEEGETSTEINGTKYIFSNRNKL